MEKRFDRFLRPSGTMPAFDLSCYLPALGKFSEIETKLPCTATSKDVIFKKVGNKTYLMFPERSILSADKTLTNGKLCCEGCNTEIDFSGTRLVELNKKLLCPSCLEKEIEKNTSYRKIFSVASRLKFLFGVSGKIVLTFKKEEYTVKFNEYDVEFTDFDDNMITLERNCFSGHQKADGVEVFRLVASEIERLQSFSDLFVDRYEIFSRSIGYIPTSFYYRDGDIIVTDKYAIEVKKDTLSLLKEVPVSVLERGYRIPLERVTTNEDAEDGLYIPESIVNFILEYDGLFPEMCFRYYQNDHTKTLETYSGDYFTISYQYGEKDLLKKSVLFEID